VQSTDWDFIVKLDGDLSFDPDYFEKCFEHFQANLKVVHTCCRRWLFLTVLSAVMQKKVRRSTIGK
jgi:hypothetical protein